MRVMVTGGSGGVGSFLIPLLEKKGHIIFNYDITEGYDILDKNMLREVVNDFEPECIIHLAAIASVKGDPNEILTVNVQGSINVAECSSARTILASTVAASPRKPGVYGQSKLLCEKYFDVVLRFTNVYGLSNGKGVIDIWKRRLSSGETTCIYTNCVRNFIHVIDLCNKIEMSMHGDAKVHETVASHNFSLKRLAHKYFDHCIEMKMHPDEIVVSFFIPNLKSYCGVNVEGYLQNAKMEGDLSCNRWR